MENISTKKKLLLESNQESINMVTNYIDEICGVNPDKYSGAYGNIIITMTEAVNNAIQHGNKNNPDKKVQVNFTETDTNISFTIEDEGNGFDYENVPDPTSPENLQKLNGRGIFLMKNLVDEINFHQNGRKIELIFQIS